MCQTCAETNTANWFLTPNGEYRDPVSHLLNYWPVPTYRYTKQEDAQARAADNALDAHLHQLARLATAYYLHRDPDDPITYIDLVITAVPVESTRKAITPDPARNHVLAEIDPARKLIFLRGFRPPATPVPADRIPPEYLYHPTYLCST